MSGNLRAVLTVAVLTGLMVAPATPAAAAESRLLSADPAAGTVVSRQVSAVVLTFTGAIRNGPSTVAVTGPGRTTYGRGRAEAVDRQLTQRVFPLRSGVYQVLWRVVSAGGQTTGGTFTFTVSLRPASEPTVVPARPKPVDTAANYPDSGFWTWLGLEALAAVLLLLGAAGRRRGSRPRR